MKKIMVLTSLLAAALAGSVAAQCTSPASTYDLIVTGNVALPPNGTQFMSAHVCTGGTLIDSTYCCTRLIHVEGGGTYEAGPLAYGMVYLKSGATFNAHGNNGFFVVDYEAGAVILNYAGPQNLCNVVTFPPANCLTGIYENNALKAVKVYSDAYAGLLVIDAPAGFENATLTIYDITGKQALQPLLLKQLFQNTVDISALHPGMYNYYLTGNSGFAAQGKFVITHDPVK